MGSAVAEGGQGGGGKKRRRLKGFKLKIYTVLQLLYPGEKEEVDLHSNSLHCGQIITLPIWRPMEGKPGQAIVLYTQYSTCLYCTPMKKGRKINRQTEVMKR